MTNVKIYDHGLWDHGITQGYSVNGTIYVSGQFSHDTQGAFIGEGDIETQTRQTLENLDRVLEGFGVTRTNLAYVEIYLTNAQGHAEPCIRLFKEYMGQHRPAGSLIGVTHLAFPEQLIEISAVAHTD
ncbi:Enamine deaminase RidA, house cleaning of reactive enamine intermediates, YjgF/YER057c/UK114 family [Fontibacillus panacisegetis]|uniref:Enamine deaminase RidA, house cleaning of reactive enamine intermediates, YjgF/YER057c/UK114 family n=1 Tax=Fontibacillus panacisegetis TaxID=670482 RepID=A0A1G7L921_9BACL|nr:RidA family protein [Fontibacillus panacisegetis]SDF45945.1 Enamine deaminase RidA, house cleaning of reactive enamine intermediates, YjgF/YER057c/UK114 family [Fontibacillus panacisegetis]